MGFGSTDVSRLAHAKFLAPEQRVATLERLKAELKALEFVIAVEGEAPGQEPRGMKRKLSED